MFFQIADQYIATGFRENMTSGAAEEKFFQVRPTVPAHYHQINIMFVYIVINR